MSATEWLAYGSAAVTWGLLGLAVGLFVGTRR